MEVIRRLFGASRRLLKPRDVLARLQRPAPPLVLDLRRPEEYAVSHIPGAMPLPISELSRRLHDLPRDREIVCVCGFGSNSDSVAEMLASAGFKSVNMEEGMVGWQRAGLPVEEGSS